MGEQIIFNGPFGPMHLMMLCLLYLAPNDSTPLILSSTQEVMEEDQDLVAMVDAASSPAASALHLLGQGNGKEIPMTSSLISKKT
jgi:hypothetical protein